LIITRLLWYKCVWVDAMILAVFRRRILAVFCRGGNLVLVVLMERLLTEA